MPSDQSEWWWDRLVLALAAVATNPRVVTAMAESSYGGYVLLGPRSGRLPA